MKLKLLFISALFGASLMTAQTTTFTVRVSAALDDHEERINGSVQQTGTVGNMDAGSSDLELGNEKPTADPQLVGIRFTSVAIPANATITYAYIQFTVDDFAKNTDPCVLNIQVEDNANPSTFSDNPFSLSTRTLMSASATWSVSGPTWSTVASAGPDQRTTDIKNLVQGLVNKGAWTSGNAMAFYIKGNGTREVESFDGDAPNAPVLFVQYSTTITGIEKNNSEKLSVSAFPNPFKGSFNVNVEIQESSSVNISIYDLTGKLVESKQSEQATPGTFHFTSASGLNQGMYFVKVNVNNKQQVLKLISE